MALLDSVVLQRLNNQGNWINDVSNQVNVGESLRLKIKNDYPFKALLSLNKQGAYSYSKSLGSVTSGVPLFKGAYEIVKEFSAPREEGTYNIGVNFTESFYIPFANSNGDTNITFHIEGFVDSPVGRPSASGSAQNILKSGGILVWGIATIFLLNMFRK
jgi:hypothetical protein